MEKSRNAAHADATTASTCFMFATVFLAVWQLSFSLAWIAIVSFVVRGGMALHSLIRNKHSAVARPEMWSAIAMALVFLVVAQFDVGCRIGKYLAQQHNMVCTHLQKAL